MSRAKALEIARAELATWEYAKAGDTLMLLEDETQETAYAWVVYWNSKRWYETRRLEYALAGGGPLIISKQTGHVTQYSSAYGTVSALEKYEEERQLYGLRVTADLADMRNKLLLKRLLLLSNQAVLQVAREPATCVAQGARKRLQKLQKELLRQGLATEVVPCF